ncbi:MAG: molecular chaperone TorD family protein [Slackia sp.]|nr:molecular chaperone TorD family protein [Slackia sp.]
MLFDVFARGESWIARAALCELLSLSFRYPDDVLADAVSSGDWVCAAREIAGVLGLDLPGDFDEGSLGAVPLCGAEALVDSRSLLSALRVEATRLFVGAPEPACSPYEGIRRAEVEGVPALMFVNPHSMEVERFSRACGLGRPEGTNEPLDHVATEFELLQVLALRAAGVEAAGAEGVAQAELPGGSAAAAYELFLAEHARLWMPAFAEDVAAETRHPFYRAAALLLRAFVAAA